MVTARAFHTSTLAHLGGTLGMLCTAAASLPEVSRATPHTFCAPETSPVQPLTAHGTEAFFALRERAPTLERISGDRLRIV
jgi:hypothetical protein